MKRTWRAAVLAALVIGGLASVGTPRAEAQMSIPAPYGPYSMPRGQLNRYAPVYYPRLNNNFGVGYYGPPRYFRRPRYGYGYNRPYMGNRMFSRGGLRRW